MTKESSKLVCTNCGGAIELSESGTHGICPYCNSEFFLEDDELYKVEEYTALINGKNSFKEILPHSHKRVKESRKEQLMTYNFKRMSDADSQKYIRYRSKKTSKIVLMWSIGAVACVLCTEDSRVVTTSGWIWIFDAALILLALCVLVKAIPHILLNGEDIKKATGYCEYTYGVLREGKIKFLSSDGQKLICRISIDDWDDFKEKQEIVFVRLPSIGKIVLENPKKIKKMFGY